jgi:DNA-binding NarL/FixJ family response regulator
MRRVMAAPDVQRGRPVIRVVIADDSALFREGMRTMLTHAGFEVAGLAADAASLVKVVADTEPDVAITDIRMPPTLTDEGLDAARRIRAAHPAVGVLVLSTYVETDFAEALLNDSDGRSGYLLKDRVADLDELTDAIRRIARGGIVIDPAVVAELLSRRRARDPLRDLSDRERDVLRLMAEGRSNQAIGDRLFLSPRTVEAHIRSIFTKLDLSPGPEDHRRVLAVLTFLGN